MQNQVRNPVSYTLLVIDGGTGNLTTDVFSLGGCVHTLTGHQSLTSGMELRNNVLVSGNADSTVRVWDIRTGHCLHTLQGMSGDIGWSLLPPADKKGNLHS